MDTAVTDSLIGALIDGRYLVRAQIARGGMATVYSALDERLERTVALKIIHPMSARDPHFVERFGDEGKTIARLTHPNVVAVYDQGTHDGLPYLVMEYVRGRTLRALLAQRRRLDPQDALAILEQMLAAIAAAHRAGLVHRDVKPENVLVAEAPGSGPHSLIDGVVKVADFGLAQAVEASADESQSQLMATAAYVAPELITHGHADPRTDVYSAGVVLFEMLTGRVPYSGERPVDVAWQHVDKDVPPPSRYVPGLPPVLDELVGRATRRDPGGRPTDAGAMLAEVQDARDDISAAPGAGTRPRAHPTAQYGAGPDDWHSNSPDDRHSPADRNSPDSRYDSGPEDPYGAGLTAEVPQVVLGMGKDRPSWARLPDADPAQRRATRRRVQPTAADRFAKLRVQLQRNPRVRLALAVSIIMCGLLAALGGWYYGIGRYTTTPDLVSQSHNDAVATAKRAGFTLQFDAGRYDAKAPKDTVLAQTPAAGERIVSGGQITVTLSLGPTKVPDVLGKQYELAVQDLQKMGLKVQRAEAYSDNYLIGSVAEAVPPVGTQVAPGSVVVLKVSKGRAPISLRNVVGSTLDAATSQLTSDGLKVVVKRQDSPKPKDTVLSQDPADGTGLEKGATVTLTVSNGPSEVEVPDVVTSPALSVDEARARLEQAGLKVEVIGNGSKVVIQNPKPHTKVPVDTTVQIWAAG